jgi:conjugal transfer pilin signal peptidase TrbI
MIIFSKTSRFLSKIPLVFDTCTARLVFLKNPLFKKPPFKKRWVKGLCCFLVALALISQVSNHVGLVYSRTNSLPYHLFLNLKHVTPKRGDYTCFDCPWYGGRVIKKVVGLEGDTLSYDDEGNLWVKTLVAKTLGEGRKLKVGKQKNHAKDGRLLNPIKPGVIPHGKVFVLGDHERSFDSRYEELGLVPEKALRGCLVALI